MTTTQTSEQLRARVAELETENAQLVARLDWIETAVDRAWEAHSQGDGALSPLLSWFHRDGRPLP